MERWRDVRMGRSMSRLDRPSGLSYLCVRNAGVDCNVGWGDHISGKTTGNETGLDYLEEDPAGQCRWAILQEDHAARLREWETRFNRAREEVYLAEDLTIRFVRGV